jgi:hypothetical protein
MTSFVNYDKDFNAMLAPLHGEDWETLSELNTIAKLEEQRLIGASATLQMYNSISTAEDRLNAKPVLLALLGYYSGALDGDITYAAGVLTFVKVPAAAQLGLQMKDSMRAAKEKLDTIAASL